MRHGMRIAGRCLVLGIWALALGAWGQPARGFDLVVLLDESGSMKKTDPDNARCSATEMFMRLCDERQRVALMGFSSSARVLGDFEPMGAGPGRDGLVAALRGIRSSDHWTNIETGLRQALDELIRSSSPEKQRAILLMTDGAAARGRTNCSGSSCASSRKWPIRRPCLWTRARCSLTPR